MMSDAIYDSWKVNPPCVGSEPFCSSECPYYGVECEGLYEDDEDEE